MSSAARSRRVVTATTSSAGVAPGVAAGLLWLVAVLSAGYWGLQVWGRSPVTPLAAAAVPAPGSDAAAVARALGAAAPAPAAAPTPVAQASRYRLLGVISHGAHSGAALIAIDSQPPRPYAVGASLEAGLVLQSVHRRSARLGPAAAGPSTVELSLPAPTP